MSAKRFRVEKDYFDKKSRFPEEIIKPKQDKVIPDTGDITVTDERPDIRSEGSPVTLEKGHDTKIEDSKHKAMKKGYHRYLTCQIRGQGYALESLKVREIIGVMKIRPLPRTPDFVKGIVNLRGRIIPVIDIGVKFGMKEADSTEKTCIIVMEVTGSKGLVQMGIVVDSVSEVIDINPDQIEETPAFGVKVDTDYISGMAKLEDGVNILLNIEKVLTMG